MRFTVLFKEVGKAAEVRAIADIDRMTVGDIQSIFLSNYARVETQRIADGYSRRNLCMVVGVDYTGEDKPNFIYAKHNMFSSQDYYIIGNCVFTRFKGRYAVSLDEKDIEAISRYYEDMNDAKIFYKEKTIPEMYMQPLANAVLLQFGIDAVRDGHYDYNDWVDAVIKATGQEYAIMYLPAIYNGLRYYPFDVDYNREVMLGYLETIMTNIHSDDVGYDDTKAFLLRKYGDFYAGYFDVAMAIVDKLMDLCIEEMRANGYDI